MEVFEIRYCSVKNATFFSLESSPLLFSFFQGKGTKDFDRMIPSKTSVKMMTTNDLLACSFENITVIHASKEKLVDATHVDINKVIFTLE